MKRFFRGWKFKVLLCVLVLLAGSMAYAGATGQLSTLPGKAASTVLAPIQRAAASVSEWAGGLWSRFASYGETQAENEELRRRVAELEQQLVELEQYQSENSQLKEFYGIQEDNPEWETIPAFVIGRDALSSFYSFTIDQGSLMGVAVGNPVVSSSGSLVGVIAEVGPGYARVRTILDPAVNAAVMVSRTRDSGIAGGGVDYAADGYCVMGGLRRDSTSTVGDRVITTGLGEGFPEGLLLGAIVDIEYDAGGTSLNAIIKPTEDLSSISSVMVIKSFA